MRRSLRPLLLLAPFLAGCALDPFTLPDHPPIEGVRFVDGEGREMGLPLEIPGGWSQIEVRFLDEAGRDIEGLEPRYSVVFYWSPVEFMHAEEAPDAPFARLVHPLAGACDRGTVSVGYGRHGLVDEWVVGPFPVVVGPPHISC